MKKRDERNRAEAEGAGFLGGFGRPQSIGGIPNSVASVDDKLWWFEGGAVEQSVPVRVAEPILSNLKNKIKFYKYTLTSHTHTSTHTLTLPHTLYAQSIIRPYTSCLSRCKLIQSVWKTWRWWGEGVRYTEPGSTLVPHMTHDSTTHQCHVSTSSLPYTCATTVIRRKAHGTIPHTLYKKSRTTPCTFKPLRLGLSQSYLTVTRYKHSIVSQSGAPAA